MKKIDTTDEYVFEIPIESNIDGCYEYEDIILDGKLVNDIIKSYIHVVKFNHANYIVVDGGVIANEEYLIKTVIKN